jgi:hypothetical protein
MKFDKYISFILIAVVIFLIFITIFNRYIDPYSFYKTPFIDTIEVNNRFFSSHVRMSKAQAVRKLKPDSIVLGNSRAEYGINPKHPGWKSRNVYNLALSSANLYELFRYLQHAQNINPLHEVVLMVDFVMFNASNNKNEIDFSEDRLSVNSGGEVQNKLWTDLIPTLASLDATIDSIKSIALQDKKGYSIYLSNGFRESTHNSYNIKKNGGHHKAFLTNERKYLNKNYNSFKFKDGDMDNWDIFNKLLKFSRINNIKLYIAISPIHARQLQVIKEKGLWDMFEQWKRKLILYNKNVANFYNKPSYDIWDFSGFSDYTKEDVSSIKVTSNMHWYWESSHYKKELGDIMLSKILDCCNSGKNLSNEFGLKIDEDNIEYHLQTIRGKQKQWGVSNFKDILEIRKLKN